MGQRKKDEGLTSRTATARAEALEEAAGHLDLSWTDDADEIKAGQWLAQRLRVEAYTWRLKAQNLSAEVERLRALLAQHNQECHDLCEGRKASGTLCAAYNSRGRSCPDCPKDNVLGA
jgi:hypothetical protein